MSVHIIPEAVHSPGYCSASGTTSGPFVDTGFVVRDSDPRTILAVSYLHSIAAEIGLVPATELDAALEALDEMTAGALEVRGRVERFDEDIENVSEALLSFLTIQRSRQGLVDELAATRAALAELSTRIETLERSDAS